MKEVAFEIRSVAETEILGRIVASVLEPSDVVGLSGDLGAGKTTLARAVAYGLGVPETTPVTSPTFILINELVGRMSVYHIDLYRLDSAKEIYDLGLWEYYDGNGVCLVEWCDRVEELWPKEALVLRIELGEGENRRIFASGTGRAEELMSAVANRWSQAFPERRNR